MQEQGRALGLRHLVERFFEVAAAKPLGEAEAAKVGQWLGPGLEGIFSAQGAKDQRHGYEAALVVIDRGVTEPDVIRAALLHDVGKRHARLGISGRILASLLIKLHLPVSRRMAIYRDHGTLAAGELEALGAEPVVVDFARHHHGQRPPTIDRQTWAILQAADQPANTRSAKRAAITS